MPVATGEIRQAVLERSELTKKEILLLWGLGDDEYATLRAELAAVREIEPGSTRTGGFRVRQKRWRRPPETEQPLLDGPAGALFRAVDRLRDRARCRIGGMRAGYRRYGPAGACPFSLAAGEV